ncbi:MAG: hypothetical protein LWY06_01435 [Firmicutes bacterium]|nr:hypothetical protein [Bacillota bacterium]
MAAIVERLKGIKRVLLNNPVLLKEMRIGLREKRVFIIQTIYMLVLGIVSFFFLLDMSSRNYAYQYAETGRNFFKTICIIQWFLIVLISPSLTSNSISSEKEKKTYDMLLVTLLNAPDIIIGKLTYAASYLVLLLASSLPLVALVFFIGGVTPLEITVNYICLLAWGILSASMALFFSSREHRSSVATSQSYGLLILLGFIVIGPYLAYFWESGQFIGYSLQMPEVLLWAAVYFNIIWAFLFLFYKTANNVRPAARHVLALHRLFITGWLINIVGSLAAILVMSGNASTAGYSSFPNLLPGTTDDKDIGVIWSLFTVGSMFFMGCFIERIQFPSNKEEAMFAKSLTSKKLFFPLFFLMSGLVLVGLFLGYGRDAFKVLASMGLFSFFMIFIVMAANEIHTWFNGKVRPVFIYFPLLIAVSVLPMFTWVIAEQVPDQNAYYMGGQKVLSIFSFIFAQPALSIQSIWDPSGSLGMLAISPGTKVPTFFFSLVFYGGVLLFIKVISLLIGLKRKMTPSAQAAQAPQNEVKQ